MMACELTEQLTEDCPLFGIETREEFQVIVSANSPYMILRQQGKSRLESASSLEMSIGDLAQTEEPSPGLQVRSPFAVTDSANPCWRLLDSDLSGRLRLQIEG